VGLAKNAIGVLYVTRSDGRSERLQGKGSFPLFEGDELRTGPGAKALIELTDGTRAALNELTTLQIRSRQEQQTEITRILTLLLGEIWVKTRARQGALEVETPAALAGVLGTEFSLKVFPDGRSVLTVLEGLVEFPVVRFRGIPGGRRPSLTAAGNITSCVRGEGCTKPTPADGRSGIAWIADVVD